MQAQLSCVRVPGPLGPPARPASSLTVAVLARRRRRRRRP